MIVAILTILKYVIYPSLFLDVNECSTGTHSCGLNTKCVNLPGTYSCPCKTGFAGTSSPNVCEGKELATAKKMTPCRFYRDPCEPKLYLILSNTRSLTCHHTFWWIILHSRKF